MKDVAFIQANWKKMRDGIGDLIGLGRWGKGMIDTLKDLTDNLEDVESDIRKYDSDGFISFEHSSQKKQYQAVYEDYEVMHDFTKKVGDIVHKTIDERFYKDIDAFVEKMRDLDPFQYKTTNRIGATEMLHIDAQTFEIDKQEVTMEDLFSGDNFYGEQLKLEFETWKQLNSDQDFDEITFVDYQQVAIQGRAFEYTSIRDQQLNEEFWFSVFMITATIIAGAIFLPAGFAIGTAYGAYELGSAVTGIDLKSGRELSTGERWFRGLLSPLEIVPGVAAIKRFSGPARAAHFGLDLNKSSSTLSLKQITASAPSNVHDITKVVDKQTSGKLIHFSEARADRIRVNELKKAAGVEDLKKFNQPHSTSDVVINLSDVKNTKAGTVSTSSASSTGSFVSKVDEVSAGGIKSTEKLSRREQLLSQVTNKKLRNSINQMFRPNATVGDGSLAAAVRLEVNKGVLTGGKSHIIKAKERIKNLENILAKENLTVKEREINNDLLIELKRALNGR